MIRTVIRSPRRGFSLVELLVVIGLITFLMTLAVATLRNAIAIARQRATETTILKIHGLMQQRIDAFNRYMEKVNLSPNSPPIRNMANNWLNQYSIVPPQKALETMVKKQFFKNRFPQNFAEYPASGGFTALEQTGITYNSTVHDPNTESAALLYWILTNSEVYGVAPVDESEFNSSEVKDTDGDGYMEFVDGWGRPLRYYRWPTHLIRPGGSGVAPGVITSGGTTSLANVDRTYATIIWSGLPAAPTVTGELDPLSRDPDDPTGQIWRWASYLANVQGNTGPIIAIQNFFGTPQTYHAFLIVSAGPDGKLGMDEPCNPTTLTYTSPGTDTAQGRLAAPDTTFTPFANHPMNDNISNRKR